MSSKRVNPDPGDVDWGGAPTVAVSTEVDSSAPTMAPDSATASEPSVAVQLSNGADVAERYRVEKSIGRGGMADVHLCRDKRIGRKVAIKSLRQDDDSAKDRFLREVRVQGQLEHPAVVPVYDLGIHSDGRPFFTMRRLRGATLREIIAGRRDGDPEVTKEHPQRRLLSDFTGVCLAIDYAHQHGVVHRDLKPENIMLGDFGEVYVLDWGIAKVAGEDTIETETDVDIALDGDLAVTRVGSVFGTPGYMAPEQVVGESAGPAADVYALGSILFELLTGADVNTGKTVQEVLEQTRDGVDARISERFPELDIAPELEAICLRALATDPGERYPNVRALHDELERYLDGDRDLARRRELADGHAERAAVALVETNRLEARATAMREAGRALALDPNHAEAAGIVTRLLLDPPSVEPPEIEDAVAAAQFQSSKRLTRLAAYAYLAVIALVPVAFWAGVRNWTVALAICGLVGVTAAVTFIESTREAESPSLMRLALLLNGTLFGLLAYMFGPFLVVPGVAAFAAGAFLLHYHLRPKWLSPVVMLGSVFVPLGLEWAGIVAPSYRFEDGVMVMLPRVIDFEAVPMLLLLSLATLATIIVSAAFVFQLRCDQLAADRKLHLQAWHMRQVLPEADKSEQ